MADTRTHSVSVAGIVVDEQQRILVVQRRDNLHWEPPGGVLEQDENFEQGVVREVLEETGVRVQVEKLTGVYKNMSQAIVALVFRCRPVSGEVSPTAETRTAKWVPLADVVSLMTPAYAIRVQDAFGDEPVTRSHDGVNLLASTT